MMNKIRDWGFPIALAATWMVVAAYVVLQVASSPMPVIRAPEVVISVDQAPQPS